jgi:lysyl-tRNA synthetase class 1
MLLQIPGVDVAARVEAEKGSALNERERAIFDERAAAARAWLDAYAPDRARLAIQATLPAAASELDADQRAFLTGLGDAVSATSPSGGDAWQAAIFAAATGAGVPAGRAFAAIYQAFLGRTNGPRAGWLLAGLEPSFVVDRLREAAGGAFATASSDRGGT